jgi:hypothetical protein
MSSDSLKYYYMSIINVIVSMKRPLVQHVLPITTPSRQLFSMAVPILLYWTGFLLPHLRLEYYHPAHDPREILPLHV